MGVKGVTGNPKGSESITMVRTQWAIWDEVVDGTFLANAPPPPQIALSLLFPFKIISLLL